MKSPRSSRCRDTLAYAGCWPEFRLRESSGADAEVLRIALASEADDALARSVAKAHLNGVTGTPTSVAGAKRISGLRPREVFENWADSLTGRHAA